MEKSIEIGVLIGSIVLVGLVVFISKMMDNLAGLKIVPLRKHPYFSELERNNFFPEEILDCSYVKPNLKNMKLKYANPLSAFLISAYSELCRDAALLRESFLDNLYADNDAASNWLGLSASELKEAAGNAADIISEGRRPALKKLTEKEVADLTVSFFYAALKRMRKEHGAEVESKEERDKTDLFSEFERTISIDDTDSIIRSIHIMCYSLFFGFNLNIKFYSVNEFSRGSEIGAMYAKYNQQVRTIDYPEFILKGSICHFIYIFHDLDKKNVCGVAE